MAFIDELTIRASAGRGGDGVVRWLHLKGKEYSGASGGNGGKGGSVYFRSIRDIGALARYTGVKEFNAMHGESGQKNSRHGKSGDDLVIEVPIGSFITNLQTEEVFDLSVEGMEVLALRGGNGGLGNEYFKSSRNVTPEESTPGKEGETAHFHIELRLVVDGGFIGLPNAGKSSLLNALTGSHAKIGDYPFTTLDPNLGALYGFVLADIPGLIEGASKGKGLGYKFLRHITRTRMLLHCISLEHENPIESYRIIRKELDLYGHNLAEKPELVILTKADMVTDDVRKKREEQMRSIVSEVLTATVLDDVALKVLRDRLMLRLKG